MTHEFTRDEVVALQIAHYKADQYRQGDRVWCDMGCMGQHRRDGQDPYDHALNARVMLGNAPVWYARLRDAIFEGLPGNGEHARRMIRLTEVMPWHADEAAWERILALTMLKTAQIAARHSTHESVTRAVALYERWVDGDKPTQTEWVAAAAKAAQAVRAAAETARIPAYREICEALEAAMSAETGLTATFEIYS